MVLCQLHSVGQNEDGSMKFHEEISIKFYEDGSMKMVL